MLISDAIAQMLLEMLEENDGILELQRNDMAMRVGCAPSQINYVITSRFTPQHGYVVESQRGGGGYIRIIRKQMNRDTYFMHFLSAVGDALTEGETRAMLQNLFDHRAIDENTSAAMMAATSSAALHHIQDKTLRDIVRADILRQLILSQMV